MTATAAAESTTYSPAKQTIDLGASVADVSHPNDEVSEGTVTFTITDGQGHSLGSQVGTATVSGGVATGNFSLNAGVSLGSSYTISASYSDGANTHFTDSGHDVTGALTVNSASATTAFTNSSTPYSPNSQIIPLTAVVSNASHAGVTVPEGSVLFTLTGPGGTIGTPTSGTVTGGIATANYSVPPLALGTYTVSVSYSDSSTHDFTDGGDTSGTLTVGSASVVTTANNPASSVFYSTASQTVALTASVADLPYPSDIVNEGTVVFQVENSSSVVVGSSGPVTFNTSTDVASTTYTLPKGLAAGTYTIVDVYNDNSGNGYFVDGGPNFDNTGTLTISSASITTAANALTTTYSAAAQTVTLSATLTDTSHNSDLVNEGAVAFTVTNGGVAVGHQVGTSTISGGVATASFSLNAGLAISSAYTINATYSDTGTNDFTSSPGSPSKLTVAIGKATATANPVFAAFTTAAADRDAERSRDGLPGCRRHRGHSHVHGQERRRDDRHSGHDHGQRRRCHGRVRSARRARGQHLHHLCQLCRQQGRPLHRQRRRRRQHPHGRCSQSTLADQSQRSHRGDRRLRHADV